MVCQGHFCDLTFCGSVNVSQWDAWGKESRVSQQLIWLHMHCGQPSQAAPILAGMLLLRTEAWLAFTWDMQVCKHLLGEWVSIKYSYFLFPKVLLLSEI